MSTNEHNYGVPHANFSQYLQQHARAIPDQVAYRFLRDGRDDEEIITFAGLDVAARAAAATLQWHCAPGDRVLILLKPGLDYVIGFMGCLYAGLIAVPAYPPGATKTLDRLDGILADCHPTAALTTREDAAVIAEKLAELAPKTRVLDVTQFDRGAAGDWRSNRSEATDVAFLQYTSGSTGSPKGVIVTHSNLVHNSQCISKIFATDPDSHIVSWLPPYHDMGLVGGILQSLFVGFPATLIAPIHFLQRPLRWLQAISRYRATISGGPNFAYELCVRKIKDEELDSLDLSSWQVAFNGAEHVRAQTIEAFRKRFARCGLKANAPSPCYGLAEGTLLVTGSEAFHAPVIKNFHSLLLEDNKAQVVPETQPIGSPDVRVRPLASSGRGLPGYEPFIIDPTTEQRLPDSEIGEICILGGNVASGYWQRPEATAATFRPASAENGHNERYFRTGDLGFLLDGELYVTGRIKDLIIVNGVNHHPSDIENTVLRVEESFRPDGSAAFGVAVDETEQVVVVQEIERRALKHLDVPSLLSDIRSRLWQQHKLATPAILLVQGGTLPRTSSGKIRRQECKRLLTPFIHERGPVADAGGLDRKLVAMELDGKLVFDASPSREAMEA